MVQGNSHGNFQQNWEQVFPRLSKIPFGNEIPGFFGYLRITEKIEM